MLQQIMLDVKALQFLHSQGYLVSRVSGHWDSREMLWE